MGWLEWLVHWRVESRTGWDVDSWDGTAEMVTVVLQVGYSTADCWGKRPLDSRAAPSKLGLAELGCLLSMLPVLAYGPGQFCHAFHHLLLRAFGQD